MTSNYQYQYQTMPHRQLQEKYFYRVQGRKDFWVGTNEKIPRDKTPQQMIMDRETLVVYLVGDDGMLYMQPAEMFPKEILYAPLWKTIPLPNVEFHRQVLTPPTTPQYQSRSVQPHAYQQGYASGIATYTGRESANWAETRHRRDSQVYSTTPSQRATFAQTQPNGHYYPQYVPVPAAAPAQPKTSKNVRFV